MGRFQSKLNFGSGDLNGIAGGFEYAVDPNDKLVCARWGH